jgi:glycosyltransferase involved in cell wall biosynthesis
LTLPNGHTVKAGDPVITYVARNLEPYRGFHSFMRTLERVQKAHKTCHAIIVGGDDASYGQKPQGAANWREKMLQEVTLDASRTHFLGKVPYDVYRKVLQVSAAHVYLTYPFVLSWSMLEAMASGCLIVGSDTAPVREIISNGRNGLLVDFFTPQRVAEQIALCLNHPADMASMRHLARVDIQNSLSAKMGEQGYKALVAKLHGAAISQAQSQHQTRHRTSI